MHVHVNAAVSADGKLSSRRREQIAISGPDDFDRVDRIRAAADAVAVGVGTVLADDPRLTLDDEDRRVTRLQNGRPGNPARVVFDSRGRTPLDARILDDAADTHVVVADPPDDRVAALRDAGAIVHHAPEQSTDETHDGADGSTDGQHSAEQTEDGESTENNDDSEVPTDGESTEDHTRVDMAMAVERLSAAGIDRLMIEGGGEVIFSAFAAGVVDELTVYVGSLVIGGRESPTLADGEGFVDPDRFPSLRLADVSRLDDGVLLSYEVG